MVYLQCCLVAIWLVSRETTAVSARSSYIIQPRTMSRHFMQSRKRRQIHAYLVVTCHLHFQQNVLDFLPATAVTRGWNGHRNKSQQRKLTVEKKILPPAVPVGTRTRDLSDHESGALTTELPPFPHLWA